jgi:hypothetical protein
VRRRLFNLATAISLVLAVAVGVLGAWSYWRYEGISRAGGVTSRSLVSFGGRLIYTMSRGSERGPMRWTYYVTALARMTRFQPMMPPRTWWEQLGFSYGNRPGVIVVRDQAGHNVTVMLPNRDVTVMLPHWFLVIVFSLFPAWGAIAWWRGRARRAARGFDVNCAATA